MSVLSSTLHTCVFSRTDSGRRAVSDPRTLLSQDQWRLLLMVNGETPFADLAGLSPSIDTDEVVGPLLHDGLIEPLRQEITPAARPQAWRLGTVQLPS